MAITMNKPKANASLANVTQQTVAVSDEILGKIGEVAQSYDANNPSMILSAVPRLGVPNDMEVDKVYPIGFDFSSNLTLEWRTATTKNPETGENWQYLAASANIQYNGNTAVMPLDGWQLMGVCAHVAENGQMPDVYAKVYMQSRKTGSPVKSIELFSDAKCTSRISINPEKFKVGEVEAIGF